MYIDKFVVTIGDLHTKKVKKIKVDADTAVDAHKKALDFCNALTQDITKITNAEKQIVFSIEEGFKNE